MSTSVKTLLLRPEVKGCAYIVRPDFTPHCTAPPAYELTCAVTGMSALACVEHAALIRIEHPDWVAQIRTAA